MVLVIYLKVFLNRDPSALLFLKEGDSTYRAKIQQNLYNIYSFGNGWWFTGQEIDIYCGDGSFDKAEYQNWCSTKPGHVHFVNKYGDNDAMMFCNRLVTAIASFDLDLNRI